MKQGVVQTRRKGDSFEPSDEATLVSAGDGEASYGELEGVKNKEKKQIRKDSNGNGLQMGSNLLAKERKNQGF